VRNKVTYNAMMCGQVDNPWPCAVSLLQ